MSSPSAGRTPAGTPLAEPARPATLPLGGTLLLLGLAGALLLLGMGRLPLLGPDEPRYARVAVEMHRAGAWVVPTLHGAPWLEKPPLYYWLAGLAFSVLGETETAARLPSLLAGLFLVCTTSILGARLYGRAAGLHAGFILATSLLVFAYGHAASMDMLLASTVSAGIGLLGLRLLGIAGRLAVPAAGVLVGLAALAKGPLGVLLPLLVVGGFLLADREGRWGRIASPSSLVAFALVAVPWYAAILWREGGRFVDVFLLGHNVERFTTTIHHHPGSLGYYVPVLALGLFPWSGLLIPGIGSLRVVASPSDRFLVCWLVLPFLFFSVAGSKLPGYILPCLPPLALAMGRAAARLASGDRPPRGFKARAPALVGVALGSLVATVPYALWRRGEADWALALPAGVWALLATLAFSQRVAQDAAGALSILRVGAAGFLVLAAQAAPPILTREESGSSLFLPAHGREVLAFGAWRTAWMAGYFYNDGHVEEVGTLAEVVRRAEAGPTLVLCGPGERRQLEALPRLRTRTLSEGPRANALLETRLRE